MADKTTPRVGDDAVRNAHVDVLKHWKSVLAETHTPLLPTAEPTSIGYTAWFIDSAIDLAPSLPLTKLARWVGFIQGILASHNYLNVKAERDRTRPIFECERRSITGRAEALEEATRNLRDVAQRAERVLFAKSGEQPEWFSRAQKNLFAAIQQYDSALFSAPTQAVTVDDAAMERGGFMTDDCDHPQINKATERRRP